MKLTKTQMDALRAMADQRVTHITIGYTGTVVHRPDVGAITFRASTGEAIRKAGLLVKHIGKGTGDCVFYTLSDAARQIVVA